jgi:putative nucleotidyltransferase with HDIG domain
VVVWIALAGWLAVVAWSLAVVRVAGDDTERPRRRSARARVRQRIWQRPKQATVIVGEGLLLGTALAVAVVSSSQGQWQPTALVGLLSVLAVGSDFMTVDAKRFRISGSSLGLVLAMTLLGPAPAVAIGLACAIADAARSRTRGPYLLSNLATHATFPLVGALILQAAHDQIELQGGWFALAVLVVFMVVNALNFALIAGHVVLMRGGSLHAMFRTVYLPVLPWELASGVLTAMAVYGFELYGLGTVGLFALALAVFQLLLRALLQGQANTEEVERRTDQLDVRHEGMLGLLLETLALRDPSAARHAAAVAHYAHELAVAAGLPPRDQAVVHTAGLMHDIGKEALPDHILLGRGELHPTERRLVERHPVDGARLLLRVEGMGDVATAVLAHHERTDGRGYPDGLAGEEIPVAARILAVAEVYDVLTAPDSYRAALSPAEAEDELRRVAGSQLDGRLVWLFATQVLRGRHAEHVGHIADLEAELQVQRRVRGALDQPLVLGPPV